MLQGYMSNDHDVMIVSVSCLHHSGSRFTIPACQASSQDAPFQGNFFVVQRFDLAFVALAGISQEEREGCDGEDYERHGEQHNKRVQFVVKISIMTAMMMMMI